MQIVAGFIVDALVYVFFNSVHLGYVQYTQKEQHMSTVQLICQEFSFTNEAVQLISKFYSKPL